MKTALVFLALLLGIGTVHAKEIASKDTVNGWYFLKASGSGSDTTYSHLTSKSYEGKSAQVFGNFAKNNTASHIWRKNLDRSYPFPKFINLKLALDSIGTDSLNFYEVDLFIGSKKDTAKKCLIASGAINGWFLRHPEWFPRPYWNDFIPPSYDTTEFDSVDFVELRFYYNSFNKDPRFEFILDNLEFFYGKGKRWEDLIVDSSIIIDRFGDPDPIPPTPIAEISERRIDFGAVGPDSIRIDTIRVRNVGDADLIISNVVTNLPNFSVRTISTTVAPQSSTDVIVEFVQDTVKGLKEGILTIEHNGSNKTDTINLVADWKEPDPPNPPDTTTLVPKLSFTPRSADFGTLKVNSAARETTIVLRNSGNDTLHGSIGIFGNGFSVSDSDKVLTIAPMDSVIRIVKFCPETTGKTNGFLVIKSNVPDSPDTVFLSGAGEIVDGINDDPEIPVKFGLSQNYPNPFNPSTTIEFSLPKRSFVNLTIYNLIGQEVGVLVNEELGAGIHRNFWNAGNIPSGTYFYRLTTDNFVATKKMVLMK
jgi:hypothetical protein